MGQMCNGILCILEKKNLKQSHHICRKVNERGNHGKQSGQIEKPSTACFLSYEEPRLKIMSIYVHIRVFVCIGHETRKGIMTAGEGILRGQRVMQYSG